MKPTNSNTASYQPGDPPDDPAQMPRFMREELAKLKAAYDALAAGFDTVVYAAPPKPRAGMRRNADGVQWNPGSGGGLYRYDGTTWRFLG
jgi:hypothetical protein